MICCNKLLIIFCFNFYFNVFKQNNDSYSEQSQVSNQIWSSSDVLNSPNPLSYALIDSVSSGSHGPINTLPENQHRINPTDASSSSRVMNDYNPYLYSPINANVENYLRPEWSTYSDTSLNGIYHFFYFHFYNFYCYLIFESNHLQDVTVFICFDITFYCLYVCLILFHIKQVMIVTLERLENVLIVEQYQRHFGEEMELDTTCVMHVDFIPK